MTNSQFLVKPLQMPKRIKDSIFLVYFWNHGFACLQYELSKALFAFYKSAISFC